MKNIRLISLCVLVIAMTGCHSVTVTTGLPVGTTVIENEYATSWLWGLVPPETVEAASECIDGVAIVETEQSFAHGFLRVITCGIYTPWHITVTCGASGSASADTDQFDVSVDENATGDTLIAAFTLAADRAVELGQPIAVRFE